MTLLVFPGTSCAVRGGGSAPGCNRPAPVAPAPATVELLAAPFLCLRDVARFQRALTDLPGVRGVQVQRLRHGALRLRVECGGAAALVDALAGAWTAPLRVLTVEPHRVDLVLGQIDPDHAAEARRAGPAVSVLPGAAPASRCCR